MGLKKGMTNNPSGRPAGTANKVTSELRTVLKNLIYVELENLPTNLDNLDNKDRIEILIKLIPYVLPKIETVPIDKGEPLNFEWD